MTDDCDTICPSARGVPAANDVILASTVSRRPPAPRCADTRFAPNSVVFLPLTGQHSHLYEVRHKMSKCRLLFAFNFDTAIPSIFPHPEANFEKLSSSAVGFCLFVCVCVCVLLLSLLSCVRIKSFWRHSTDPMGFLYI